MGKKAVHVIVEGMVQGVGYRYFTIRKAQSMGLTGWVRNRPDHSVEAVIEGEESDLHRMLAEMRRGPYSARVDNMDMEWGEYTNSFNHFSVRY